MSLMEMLPSAYKRSDAVPGNIAILAEVTARSAKRS